jgi:excisionase family DNA binding protein
MALVTINTDDLMSVQDAAKTLGRPRLAVYRMIKRNAITGIELGGVTFVLTAEIRKLKEGGDKTETNEPVQKQ